MRNYAVLQSSAISHTVTSHLPGYGVGIAYDFLPSGPTSFPTISSSARRRFRPTIISSFATTWNQQPLPLRHHGPRVSGLHRALPAGSELDANLTER